ncbi:hypothetical protein Tco_0788616, partial [Tanacetum coccineum]
RYTKKIKEQEDSLDTMSGQLVELKNTVKIKQTKISKLEECLRKEDSEKEHLKSKVVDFTTVQNLQVQVEELKMSSSVQKEYNDLLAFSDLWKQRLETKFKFSKHDTSLEKMIEMIEKEYESNVSNISMSSSTFESKNLELVKEMRDKVKYFDDEKNVFETKISKLEKGLQQRVKDFDDVKTKLSKRTNKFETYFANLEKENALLKSQLTSQNYTSLQKENNDLRTSYNVLKEKHETSCEKLEKENNDLKMYYKRLFDSIKQKKAGSQVFTKSIPKVNVSKNIYTGKSSNSISKKLSQFTTYSLQKDKKYLKKQHSSETFASQNHEKNESSKQIWKIKGENISKPFKYSRNEMFSLHKRDDSVLKKVKDVRSIKIAGSTFARDYFNNIIIVFNNNSFKKKSSQSRSLLQYSRDGYVIEGELKEYEDSRIKDKCLSLLQSNAQSISSYSKIVRQQHYVIEIYLQDQELKISCNLLKIQVAKRRSR